MTPTEYQDYLDSATPPSEPTVSADLLTGPPRTLTLGYNGGDRSTLHVYLFERAIHMLRLVDLTEVAEYQHGKSLPASLLRPGKRAMPQYTDPEFARLMRGLGNPLTFSKYEEPRYSPFECRRRDNVADYRNFLFESV